MVNGKTPAQADAPGQLEDEIEEQARTIDSYRDECTRLMAERDDLRGLVAEILDHLEAADIYVDDEIRAAWRERAELDES